jgi:2-polyprenyl-3-methyl-5-hydroxy-6-metoxy-1,4-benzoquinol methylase
VPAEEVRPTLRDLYTSGLYLKKHPGLHVEESPWKARQVLSMLERHDLRPRSICEVGCGAGEILRQLQLELDPQCRFWGYDISPQAVQVAKSRENERLRFMEADILRERQDARFDVILLMDVLEHIEDHFGFLRELRKRAEYKLFHCSLTISLQTVLRRRGLLHVRDLYGMVNYFTKETLLQTLKDTGYEVLDHFYTRSCTDLRTRGLPSMLMRFPRRLAYRVNPDLAARTLGGYRLLVLAR